VLVVYAMFVELNDERARSDVLRGYAHRALPLPVYRWLYPGGSSWDAPIVGEPRGESPAPSADLFSVRGFTDEAPPSREIGKKFLTGSNNWVVGGALTRSGRALVSNDMHLGHDVPNIWYQARLVVVGDEARNVTGVTLPGTPFVTAGSNGRIAWGYTNSYGDWSDAVLIRPGVRPGTYRTPRGDLDFRVHRETIEVKDAQPVDFEIRETIWGPVDDTIHYLVNYQKLRKMRLSASNATREATESVGSAILLTSISLAAGFLVLAASDFEVNRTLGQFTAIILTVALIVDLILLPAILIRFDKKKFDSPSAEHAS